MNDAVQLQLSIPTENWKKWGSAQETLKKELAMLPSVPRSITITSAMPLSCSRIVSHLGIKFHDQTRMWTKFHKIDIYEYAWESTDGHMLDVLHVRGAFDHDALFKLIELFDDAFSPLEFRWDATIHFFE